MNNSTLLYIIDYYSRFSSVKQVHGLLAGDIIRTAKIVFSEFGLPKEVSSDMGMNFISDKFRQFCRQPNRGQAITSSYHHQSNGQMEACIK